ncbi:threonine ammonia-lyase IlvA [Paracoccaceae bacterium GXU_MW_L88]
MSAFTTGARQAEAALRDLFPATPLQRNEMLSGLYDADIWLKREDLSPVRSYKIRGAFNAMRKHLAQNPEAKRFVCASAGNHAQGFAFACQHFGVDGTVFMPVTTPQQKIEKTRVFGGENISIELTGDYFDQTLTTAKLFCEKEGASFLPPYDSDDIIEGQASVAVEALEQLGRAPDLVVVPVGGGGVSAGIAKYLADEAPETELRFVEPTGAPSLQTALKQGELVTLNAVDNFVDGASVARIGNANFEVLKRFSAEHCLDVPENRICQTMLTMLNHEGIVLEPAGALTVDVLQDLRDEIRGKTVICVVSGGNFDFERLPEVKERAMRYSGTKKYFIIRFPQRPGALRDFLHLLGPNDDVARFEYLKKSARNFGSVLLGVETDDASNFPGLEARMEAAGFSYIDITDNDTITGLIV